MNVESIKPEYGKNYRRGHIGFTWTQGAIVSCGIAYFTSFERMADIKVSHTFIVTGPDECVEATPKGVVVGNLDQYFNDPKVLCFFREPRIFNQPLIERTIAAARSHLGEKYDYKLFVADAIAGSRLGQFLGLGKLVTKWMNGKGKICSELVASAMKAQPEYNGVGVFKLPEWEIRPQNLFEDDGIFKPWKRGRYSKG